MNMNEYMKAQKRREETKKCTKIRTNRSGKLDLDGNSAKKSALQRVLGSLGILDALEKHEAVTPGVGRDAIKSAVWGEESHKIGLANLVRYIANPQIVGRGRRIFRILHRAAAFLTTLH